MTRAIDGIGEMKTLVGEHLEYLRVAEVVFWYDV